MLSETANHNSRNDTTEAVDELMKSLVRQHKDAIAHLRRSILELDASISEGVKWNAPSFRTTEYFATTNLRTKEGIGVILHLGAKIRDRRRNPTQGSQEPAQVAGQGPGDN